MAPHPLPLSAITCAGWLVGEERHSVGNAIIKDSDDGDDDNEASLQLQNISESSSRSRVVSVRRCVREGNAVTSATYRFSGVISTQSGERYNKSKSQSDLHIEDLSTPILPRQIWDPPSIYTVYIETGIVQSELEREAHSSMRSIGEGGCDATMAECVLSS